VSRGSKPGERRGGRVRGTPNKKTEERAAQFAAATGKTPLEFLIEIMNQSNDLGVKLEAAKAAAPYCHAKLASYDVNATHSGDLTVEIINFDGSEAGEHVGEMAGDADKANADKEADSA
jgi:hypothetical protein